MLKFWFGTLLMLVATAAFSQGKEADSSSYLKEIKQELKKEWPKNRTINLVFHGHSVPAGYFKTPVVNTLDAYPYQLLKLVKERYPFAVVNCINTSIGGENSQSGERRFVEEVLSHRPDVLFLDYALHDRRIVLEEARKAWESMIEQALARNCKVILLTPTPDQRVDLLAPGNELEQYTLQIRELAQKYEVGLVDSYQLFYDIIKAGGNIPDYMAQVNHPNAQGHTLVTNAILRYFE